MWRRRAAAIVILWSAVVAHAVEPKVPFVDPPAWGKVESKIAFDKAMPAFRDVPRISFSLGANVTAIFYGPPEHIYDQEHLVDIGGKISSLVNQIHDSTCFCRAEAKGEFLSCRCEANGHWEHKKAPGNSIDAEEAAEMERMQASIHKAIAAKDKAFKAEAARQDNAFRIKLAQERSEQARKRKEAMARAKAKEKASSSNEDPSAWVKCFIDGKCVFAGADKPPPTPPPGDPPVTVDASDVGEAGREGCDHKCKEGKKKGERYTLCYARCEVAKCRATNTTSRSQLAAQRAKLADVEAGLAQARAADGGGDAAKVSNLAAQRAGLRAHIRELSTAVARASACVGSWRGHATAWERELDDEMRRLLHLRLRQRFEVGDLWHLQTAALRLELVRVNSTLSALRRRYLDVTGEAVTDAEGDAAAAARLEEGLKVRRHLEGRMDEEEREIAALDRMIAKRSLTQSATTDYELYRMMAIRERLRDMVKRKHQVWQNTSDCQMDHKAAGDKLAVLKQRIVHVRALIANATAHMAAADAAGAARDRVLLATLHTTRVRLQADEAKVEAWAAATAPQAPLPSRFNRTVTETLLPVSRLTRCMALLRGTALYPALLTRLRADGAVTVDAQRGLHPAPPLSGVCERYRAHTRRFAEYVPHPLIAGTTPSVTALLQMASQRATAQLKQQLQQHGGSSHGSASSHGSGSSQASSVDVGGGVGDGSALDSPMPSPVAAAEARAQLHHLHALLSPSSDGQQQQQLSRGERVSLTSVQSLLREVLADVSPTATTTGSDARFASLRTAAGAAAAAGASTRQLAAATAALSARMTAHARRSGAAEAARLQTWATSLSPDAHAEMMNASLSCLCFDAAAASGADARMRVGGGCGPGHGVFPVQQFPREREDAASAAEKRIVKLLASLRARKLAVEAEIDRRFNMSHANMTAELDALLKQKWDLLQERLRYEAWLRDEVKADKLRMENQISAWKKAITLMATKRLYLANAREKAKQAQLAREAKALATLRRERAMRAQFETELARLETEKRQMGAKNERDAWAAAAAGGSSTSGGDGVSPDPSVNPAGVSHPDWDVQHWAGSHRGGPNVRNRFPKHWEEYGHPADAAARQRALAQEMEECRLNSTHAQVVLARERLAVEIERRKWEEAVVRLARPKTCRQLLGLATGGKDGVYTVFPPDHPESRHEYQGVSVYCDMTTDGGGWTLVAYAGNGQLGSKLGVSHGDFDPRSRRGSANVNALWLAQASTEAAMAWNPAYVDGANHVPRGGILSYAKAIKFDIPNPEAQTLAPPVSGKNTCDGSNYSPVNVACLSGDNCDLPTRMFTGTDSLGVCNGHAYGVVMNAPGKPDCDWAVDSQRYQAVYMAADSSSDCYGVVDTKRKTGDAKADIPTTMGLWLR